MDKTIKYLGSLPRRFPHLAPVRAIGRFRRKRTVVDKAFDTLNFSFVLAGRGRFQLGDFVCRIEEPQVFIEWPNRHTVYGPDRFWDEFFIIYSRQALSYFERAKIVSLQRPIWTLALRGEAAAVIETLCGYINSWPGDGCVDHVDRLCEYLIALSLSPDEPKGTGFDRIEQARRWLESNSNRPFLMEDLASRFGYSAMSFRRHWSRRYEDTPNEALTNVRIQKASSLLVETRLSIAEVACQAGYQDPLYFSRRFKQRAGMTPTEFRRGNQFLFLGE